MKRRDLLNGALQGGTLVLLLGAAQIARGATIVAVRVWPAEDYTRVTIESDTLLEHRYQLADQPPPRLAVDILGLELSPALRELVGKVQPDDPNIQGIRIAQHAPGVVRLVVDMKQDIRAQVFSLPPIAAYRHRLVFDLYPTHPADPLETLIAARLKDEARKPPAPTLPGSDPLGDWLANHGAKPATPPKPPPVAVASGPVLRSSPAPVHRPTPTPPPPRTLQPASGARGTVASRMDRLIIIALDPGHGGEDPGAIGAGGTREKDVVLAIALRLRERINATSINGSPMRAFLTRDADFFVPLQTRVKKARQVQADLFISIHADAFMNRAARGASVFALSQGGASSVAAKWIADKENNADQVGGINHADPQVARILVDMSTTVQIKDSLQLGGTLLREIGKVGNLHKAKVEQASFAVLKAPDIPSVLVETAFISNPEEEQRLGDPNYQDQLADALMQGITAHFQRHPPQPRNRQV